MWRSMLRALKVDISQHDRGTIGSKQYGRFEANTAKSGAQREIGASHLRANMTHDPAPVMIATYV